MIDDAQETYHRRISAVLGPGASRGPPADGGDATAGPRPAASPRIAVYFVVAGQVWYALALSVGRGSLSTLGYMTASRSASCVPPACFGSCLSIRKHLPCDAPPQTDPAQHPCFSQVSEFRAVEALAGGAVIQEMPVHISELFLAPS